MLIDLISRIFGKKEINQGTEVQQDESLLEAKAKARAREIIVEAKEGAQKIRAEAMGVEKAIAVQKAKLDTRAKELEITARSLKVTKEKIENKEQQVDDLFKQQKEKLASVSSLTKQEARDILLQKVDKELVEEKSKRIRQMEEEVRKNSEETAKEILVSAMRYGSTDYVVEYTTSKVKLEDDEMKGRIIGKEGRNIRAFEEITGVDLDLDSNFGEIIVSCFDPIRRQVAKMALEKLIADGRIQPARIESVVAKIQTELDHIMYKAGDDLCHRVGAYSVPKDLVQMLGRFKFRFSYGQNMVEHTLEETRIGLSIAHELKVDVGIVRLGCLFHDIGKIVTEDEGTHVDLGVELLRKHSMPEKVIACVAEHHEDRPFSSVESAVVSLADHMSGARPGARGEDYELFVQRMKSLEDVAMGFDGVERAFAISAGHEVRVFVSPERVDDVATEFLAREIAKKIELEQTYPGVVKVTVIRETRVTETAR